MTNKDHLQKAIHATTKAIRKIVVARKNGYCKGEQQNIQTKFRDIIKWKVRAYKCLHTVSNELLRCKNVEKKEKKPSETRRWTYQCSLTWGEWSETSELKQRRALGKLTNAFSHWQVYAQPPSAIMVQLENHSVHIRLVSLNMDGKTLSGGGIHH